METTLAAVALMGILVLGYTYVLYPTAVVVLARFFSRPVQKAPIQPRVALIISAFNEEAVIEKKLENALRLSYPPEKLSIFVSSDGSADRTVSLAQRFAEKSEQIRVIAYEVNRGKTAALMETLDLLPADIDVVVFSDANGMYNADAVRNLVRNFADPAVGAVTGQLIHAGAGSEGFYRRYDNAVKAAESELGSCLLAEGSIFAARRELIPRIDPGTIEDILVPLTIAGMGLRVIYEPDAVSVEDFHLSSAQQLRRRRRIANRGVRSLICASSISNPFTGGTVALQLWSHKVLRWVTPLFLFSGILAAVALGVSDPSFRPLLGGAGVCGGWFLLGYVLQGRHREHPLATSLFLFVASNFAIAQGVYSALTGSKAITWQPQR